MIILLEVQGERGLAKTIRPGTWKVFGREGAAASQRLAFTEVLFLLCVATAATVWVDELDAKIHHFLPFVSSALMLMYSFSSLHPQ